MLSCLAVWIKCQNKMRQASKKVDLLCAKKGRTAYGRRVSGSLRPRDTHHHHRPILTIIICLPQRVWLFEYAHHLLHEPWTDDGAISSSGTHPHWWFFFSEFLLKTLMCPCPVSFIKTISILSAVIHGVRQVSSEIRSQCRKSSIHLFSSLFSCPGYQHIHNCIPSCRISHQIQKTPNAMPKLAFHNNQYHLFFPFPFFPFPPSTGAINFACPGLSLRWENNFVLDENGAAQFEHSNSPETRVDPFTDPLTLAVSLSLAAFLRRFWAALPSFFSGKGGSLDEGSGAEMGVEKGMVEEVRRSATFSRGA